MTVKFKSPSTRGWIRLSSVLLIVNLAVFLLPLLGIFFFRFYENELVRQTELELISQGAVIASVYKQTLRDQYPDRCYAGRPLKMANITPEEVYYRPVFPQLDLAQSRFLPPRPDGRRSSFTPLAEEIDAGTKLVPVLLNARRTTLSGMKILNPYGVTVTGAGEIGDDFSQVEEVKQALEGHYTSVIRQRISDEPTPALASISRGTGIRVFVAYPIIEGIQIWGVVYLSRTPQNILKHLYAEKEKVFLAGGLLLIVTLALALLTSYAISRPLHRLMDKTRKFAAGDKSGMHPLHYPVMKEIELLSHSFSAMARALEERSKYIRDFAMHVSHEFKTPLTSIQGAAELLQEHKEDMSSDKQHKFLCNIMADTDRLKRLVERLMELARADSISPDSSERTDLKEVMNRLIRRYEDRDVRIIAHIPDTMKVKIAGEYLEIIFTNLIDNAWQNGANKIEITTKCQPHVYVIEVRDNGSGISEANRGKIFTPFFTTRRDAGGTGLGLDIIRSLIEAHYGRIECTAHNSGDGGAVFKITLPI